MPVELQGGRGRTRFPQESEAAPPEPAARWRRLARLRNTGRAAAPMDSSEVRSRHGRPRKSCSLPGTRLVTLK